MAKTDIRIVGFVNKMAIAIIDISYGEDQTLEVDSPVQLTGKTKICVNKSFMIFAKVEVRPVPLDDTAPFFIDARSIQLM